MSDVTLLGVLFREPSGALGVFLFMGTFPPQTAHHSAVHQLYNKILHVVSYYIYTVEVVFRLEVSAYCVYLELFSTDHFVI